ncbi:MAG: acyl-CoA dehydrogenase family protein [Phycisphaerales bacterium JB058]
MELTLSDHQREIRDTFARLFESESTPDRVRSVEGPGIDETLWQTLVETGVPTFAVAEEFGGAGGDLLDLSLVVHEQGRRLGTVPLVETAVAARLLAALGERDLVQSLAGGERAAVALHPAVEGVASLVPNGGVVDRVIALDGSDLVVVARDNESKPERLSALGHAAVEDWYVGTGRPVDRTVIAMNSEASEQWHHAVDCWKVLQAALLVGVARAALDLAVEYAKERRAFDAPIGSFQALAHRLADAAVRVDGAELLARKAAWIADHDPGRREVSAAMAFCEAAEAAQVATRDGLHVFGGYGFTLEYDIQLYYQRAKAWALVYGPPAGEFERIGRLVADEGGATR